MSICQKLHVDMSEAECVSARNFMLYVDLSKAECVCVRSCIWICQKHTLGLSEAACRLLRKCVWIFWKLLLDWSNKFVYICQKLILNL